MFITKIFDAIDTAVNKQVLRGFYYNPAVDKWTEISPSVVISRIGNRFHGIGNSDRHWLTITHDGHLTAVYAIFYANENKKDTNRVSRNLAYIQNEVMKAAA